MEEEVYLNKVIHSNKIRKGLDIFAEENAHILANLILSIDGAIVGVKTAAVIPHLMDPEIKKIRIGATLVSKEFKIENENDLYRLLAVFVPLDFYF